MNELSCGDPGGPIAVRKWIGDVSAERVGHDMADGGSRGDPSGNARCR